MGSARIHFRLIEIKNRHHNRKGSVAFGVLAVAAVMLELASASLFVTSMNVRRAVREESRVITLNLAEAGIQNASSSIWNSFQSSQTFTDMDTETEGASTSVPKLTITNTLGTGRRYSVSVVGNNHTDSYTRDLTIVSVGWLDNNSNGLLDSGEPYRAIRSVMRFSFTRSGVFDYCYFINNYGWMTGFSPTTLIANGDLRANGNFDFSGGTPTINGSVFAARNDRLVPPATGVVNITPSQWSNSYYETNASSRSRQAYNASKHGAKGSAQYGEWRDLIYDYDAAEIDDIVSGAVVGDVNGVRKYSGTVISTEPAEVMPMPDLSDISRYTTLSSAYVDSKATYGDGTANPTFGQGAYVKVWNASTSVYDTVTTNGVFTGSAGLVGTSAKPIIIHGPVTFTEDVAIKGYVQGQGTIYTGRNVHVVGSITYKDPPDFRGTDPTSIEQVNEKKTLLGLAARASVIMGNPANLGTALNYMKPTFTKPRYDDAGNLIPAYDYRVVDSYGLQKHKSRLSATYITSISESISQVDAIMYTNNMLGGVVGGSSGVTFNGSIISKDEAIIPTTPMRLNYDNRIKERGVDNKPLVDIDLPRTPSVQKLTWQEI